MALTWNGTHAEAGIFKLNVHQSHHGSEVLRPEWIWDASTPGFCHADNWRGPTCATEQEAKDAAERWLLAQVGEILLGLNIPLEQQTPLTYRLQQLSLDGHSQTCPGRPSLRGICEPPCPQASR